MDKIAIVFSGQGAQYSGMGKSLYECSGAAKKLYDFADECRPGTKKQSFCGTEGELKETRNTQPCLYLVDMCAALALGEHGIKASAVAGFSLGEIAALAYAGAYSTEDGFSMVTDRGCIMQEAAEKMQTSMAAVLKIESSVVEAVCVEIPDVYAVNYNSPVQTVVAGTKCAILEFKEKIKTYPCRVVDLAVGAAFHSPFMNEASDRFFEALKRFNIRSPQIPVYSNTTAMPYDKDAAQMLKMQMKSPVKWCDTIKNMMSDGYTTFIEAGAGKTLSGLIKRISPDVAVYSVEDEESLLRTVEAVKNDA